MNQSMTIIRPKLIYTAPEKIFIHTLTMGIMAQKGSVYGMLL